MRALLLVSVGLLGLAGCTRPTERPDVLLVLLPGLRGELAGETGSGESLLIGALGQPRVRYTSAVAQSPAPYSSLASLLTGMYPSAIPICNRIDKAATQPWCTELPPQRYVLPAILRMYGYATGAIHGKMEGADLLGEGHVEVPGKVWRVGWPEVNRAAREWWTSQPSPKFLVVVASDLHADELQARTEAQMKAEYDLRMRSISIGVRELVQNLDADYAFVTSTHGTSLGERTGLREGHDAFLDRATAGAVLHRTTHVPLLVYGPEGPPELIPQAVELVDLVPTICALAEATPPANTPGMDLFGVGTDDRAYSEFGDWLALREGPWMLTFRSYLHNGSSIDPENTNRLRQNTLDEEYYSLHDVLADPLQTNNVVMADLPLAGQMRERLLETRVSAGSPPPDMMAADKVQQIRLSPSQGYW
ncbi:MAG: hypothetical protein ACOZNI_05585 [Myxococcota bacterium]